MLETGFIFEVLFEICTWKNGHSILQILMHFLSCVDPKSFVAAFFAVTSGGPDFEHQFGSRARRQGQGRARASKARREPGARKAKRTSRARRAHR